MTGPELRIGDDDREAAVAALGEHYAAGRLTKPEYDERADRAWQARTASDLRPLFVDLPRLGGPAHPEREARPGRPGPGRPGPHAARGFPPPRLGWLVPALVVLGAIAVLTHLPVFLVVLVAWLVLSRGAHRWSRRW